MTRSGSAGRRNEAITRATDGGAVGRRRVLAGGRSRVATRASSGSAMAERGRIRTEDMQDPIGRHWLVVHDRTPEWASLPFTRMGYWTPYPGTIG